MEFPGDLQEDSSHQFLIPSPLLSLFSEINAGDADLGGFLPPPPSRAKTRLSPSARSVLTFSLRLLFSSEVAA